jgi:predicted SAM-dependent methyltransferase
VIVLELGVGHASQASDYWPGLSARIIGVDVRNRGFTDVAADCEDPLPFKDNSIGGIWSSHMFEHLSQRGAVKLLKECYRVMTSGAELRLYLPNFGFYAKKYIEDGLTKEVRDNIMGQQDYPSDYHLSIWDEWTLKQAMKERGFLIFFSGTGRAPGELRVFGAKP